MQTRISLAALRPSSVSLSSSSHTPTQPKQTHTSTQPDQTLTTSSSLKPEEPPIIFNNNNSEQLAEQLSEEEQCKKLTYFQKCLGNTTGEKAPSFSSEEIASAALMSFWGMGTLSYLHYFGINSPNLYEYIMIIGGFASSTALVFAGQSRQP